MFLITCSQYVCQYLCFSLASLFPSTYISQYLCFPVAYLCLVVPAMFLITCFAVSMFQSSLPMFHSTYYVPQYLCLPVPMFARTYVSQYLCFPVAYRCLLVPIMFLITCFPVPVFQSSLPMFHGTCYISQ